MIFTTTQDLGDKKLEYLGMVTSNHVVSVEIPNDAISGIATMISGKGNVFSKKIKEFKIAAMREMATKAKKLNANAIIAFSISFNNFGNDGQTIIVSAAGTAVKFKQDE